MCCLWPPVSCSIFLLYLDVDKSHFKLLKIVGIGTHSVVWLVEKRTVVKAPGATEEKTQIAEEAGADGEAPPEKVDNDQKIDDKGNVIK